MAAHDQHIVRPKVIALFDALGILSRSQSNLPQAVQMLELLSDITKERRDCLIIDATQGARQLDNGNVLSVVAMGSLNVQHGHFQDTAILWCTFDPPRFWTFCDLVSEFFCSVLQKGIPLRGAISAGGDVHLDKEKPIYLGQPYFEAMRAEKAQLWIGVSFGPSFERDPYRKCLRRDHVVQFSAHRKPEEEEYTSTFVLDWPRKWRTLYKQPPIRLLNEMNVEPAFSEYYDLAKTFYEFSARAQSIDG
jgi:hypothetical protein